MPAPRHLRIPGVALRIRIPGRRLQRKLAVAVLALGVAVTGSATAGLLSAHPAGYVADAAPPVTLAPHGSWAAAPAVTAAQPVPRPVFLTIPAIGVRTPLIRLGLTTSGAMQVPGTTALAGWYGGSPRPGAIGSAIIGGHVDSRPAREYFSGCACCVPVTGSTYGRPTAGSPCSG